MDEIYTQYVEIIKSNLQLEKKDWYFKPRKEMERKR